MLYTSFMKRIIFFLLLTTPICGYSQLSEEELVMKALEELEISGSEVASRLITSRDFGSETLLVIPVISKQDQRLIYFDAHLAVVENTSGRVISRYSGKQDWYSDAVTLSKIEIEPTVYRLNGSNPAYGLKINYAGQSRPFPYYATELSLYIRDGKKLKRVLKDHRFSYLNGETDTHCNGEFVTHSKTLRIMDSKTKGYADLEFTDSIEKSVSTDQNCERAVVDNFQEVEILKFKDGIYMDRR